MACQRNFTGKRWSGTLISPVGRLLSVVGVMLVTLTHSSAGDLDRPRQTGCSTQLPHFPDLVVPNRDGGQSYVYLNDHTAHFPKRIPFGPPDATIRAAVAVDLTGSGRMDIVTIDEQHGVFIYYGLTDGTFSTPTPLGTIKETPYALAASDLNRDGKIDIVVGYLNAPSVVYFNTGQGRGFTPVAFGDNQGTAYGKSGFGDWGTARSSDGAPRSADGASPAEMMCGSQQILLGHRQTRG